MYIPALDKIFKVLSPLDAILGLVLELGNGLSDNVCEQIDQASARVHLRSVGREGESVLSDFE